MSAKHHTARAIRDARRAWIVGGALLIGSVALRLILQPAAPLIFGGSVIAALLFSGALLIFAFGIRGSGSVTARRPLGTATLSALAAWILLVTVVNDAIFAATMPSETLMVFGYIDSFVQFVFALVAAVQIARAGVVPYPWNWAPGWMLAAVAVPWLLSQALAVGDSSQMTEWITVVIALDSAARVGGPIFLGVLAIVLANRARRPQAVPIYEALEQPDE
jgi:hypothetical protein